MDIIGKKAVNDDGPEPDDIIDRDLASPQFISWSARKEVRQLRDTIRTLGGTMPSFAALTPMAEEAVRLVEEIDDAIEGWVT